MDKIKTKLFKGYVGNLELFLAIENWINKTEIDELFDIHYGNDKFKDYCAFIIYK